MSSDFKLDELVKTYLTIRTARDNLQKQWEAKDGELAQEMREIEQVMLTACDEVSADSIKTGEGTIIKTMKEEFICNDWPGFKQFIKDNSLVELLQQRIHKTNFKEYLTSHEGEGLPPGISTFREYGIVVRKPSSK
jgi:hypothetical protein